MSYVHSFTTSSEGPRNLYVDGITNVRDLGGWATSDGGTVRQGLIYRTGQLNTHYTKDDCITESGKRTMLEELGIRSEIDLRRNYVDDLENGGITESPLGSGVAYFNIPMGEQETLYETPEKIKTVFDVLSDANNYPLIIHCKIGTDRTGAMVYLLLGMLGVSMEDIYVDYTWSNTGNIGGLREYTKLDSLIEYNFTEPGGDTVQESCTNYLLSIGVTQEQIDTIREILIER